MKPIEHAKLISVKAKDTPMSIRSKTREGLAELLYESRKRIYVERDLSSGSEWALNNFVLSAESSNMHGKFSFERAIYEKEMLDACADPSIRKVVLCMAAQTGKSQVLQIDMARSIAEDPGPMLYVSDTLDATSKFNATRLLPMIRDVPKLKDCVYQHARRGFESGSSKATKNFAGGFLNLATARSPAALASAAIRRLYMDEVDRYRNTDEGHALDVAEKRLSTFTHDSKEILASTPGDSNVSRIWPAYQNSDRRVFQCKCPSCNGYQVLEWSGVDWSEGVANTVYICKHCKARWDDYTKNMAVRNGKWVATQPFQGTAGFHLNVLCSSFVTMKSLAVNWLECHKDLSQRKVFVNTRLAQPWNFNSFEVESIDWNARLDTYISTDEIHSDIATITCGVDCQGDRIELETVGWGADRESWSLDYKVFHGKITMPDVWAELKDFLKTKRYKHPHHGFLKIHRTCIDVGYQPDIVARFVSNMRLRQSVDILGTRGLDGNRPIFPQRAKRNKSGAYSFYQLGVDTAKEQIYEYLTITSPGPGYCHFPSDRGEEYPGYFDGLTSERCESAFVRGKQTKKWVVKGDRRNEPLDCRVYAMAALFSIKMSHAARKRKLEQATEAAKAKVKRVQMETREDGTKIIRIDRHSHKVDTDTGEIMNEPTTAQPKPVPPKVRSGPVRMNWLKT